MDRKYADFAWEQAAALLAIDSPTGFTEKAAIWVKDAFEKLGFEAKITTKGGVLVDLGGENAEDGLLLEAHADTLGGMVAEVVAQNCPVVMKIMGLPDEHTYPGESGDVFRHYGLTAEGIAAKAKEALKLKK